MTQINNNDLFARFKLVLEFISRDAVALDLPQKTLAFAPPVQDVGDDACHEQHHDPSPEALGVKVGAIQLLAEDEADPGESARPQQGPEKVKQQEPWKIDANHPRQGWCSRVEAWHELADQQRAWTELREGGFGAANAGVRFERDPAEQIEHNPATTLSEEIPER